MKNKSLFLVALVLLASCFCFRAYAQCVIPIAEGETYLEDFESGNLECWTVEGVTGTGNWAIMTGTSSTVVAFSNAASGDEARLVSPTFDLSNLSGATFSFTYAMLGFYNADVMVVSYRSSETDSWHELGSYSVNDWSNYYEESFTLENLSSTYQISFLAHSYGGYYIFVDNFEIASAGGCARPVNLQATEIGTDSALLGWSTTGNEESWVVELNNHPQTVEEQPFLMTGLDSGTEYSFRVKANCGEGQESEWSLPITFKTFCDVIVVTDDEPYFDDFESSDDFVCWYNEISYGEDGWVVDPGYVILNNTAFFIWLGGEAALISAPLDITAVTNPTLTFSHKQRLGVNYGTVDELLVGYRSNVNENWQILADFTEATSDWETVSFALPNPSATYQIIFDGIAHNAEGIYVDDVRVGNGQNVGVTERPALTAHVSPNPTNGTVTITANSAEGEVVVFDLSGRKLTTAKLVEGRVELDLSDFAPGVYTARVTNDNDIKTIKLIKD